MLNTAITKLMIDLLMKCHEKEILQHEPCNPSDTEQYISSLQQGLIEIRDYTGEAGRIKQGIYITRKGTTAIDQYIIGRQS